MQVVHRFVEEVPNLGRAIASARKAKDLSQRELGDRIGVSQNMISCLEKEEKAIAISLLRKIEGVLGVELINLKIDED